MGDYYNETIVDTLPLLANSFTCQFVTKVPFYLTFALGPRMPENVRGFYVHFGGKSDKLALCFGWPCRYTILSDKVLRPYAVRFETFNEASPLTVAAIPLGPLVAAARSRGKCAPEILDDLVRVVEGTIPLPDVGNSDLADELVRLRQELVNREAERDAAIAAGALAQQEAAAAQERCTKLTANVEEWDRALGMADRTFYMLGKAINFATQRITGGTADCEPATASRLNGQPAPAESAPAT